MLRASRTACPHRNVENEHSLLSGGESNKAPENSDSLSSGNRNIWTPGSGQSNRRVKKWFYISHTLMAIKRPNKSMELES